MTKILTIDFYNLQKNGKKVFPDEGCLVCCFEETCDLKGSQTSAHPVFSNELNNNISKYLQRKPFDIVLT